MKAREIIAFLSIKYDGNYKKIMDAIKEKEKINEEEALNSINKLKSKYVTIIDDEYPQYLKHIPAPPLILFYYGDLSILDIKNRKKLAVIGSRNSSEYGERMTINIVSKISKQVTIISGLARGIDKIAHETCIKNKGKTVAILGSGIDYIYPKENSDIYEEIKKNHLLISEYPNSVIPEPQNFPFRNRIISGLSDKILVTEAYNKSGTSVTVLHALRQGKDVMTVPYNADKNSACNKLIQDGAALVENADDVLFNL